MDRTATGKRGRSPLRGPGSRQMVPEAFLAVSREMFNFVNSPLDQPEPKVRTMKEKVCTPGDVLEMARSKIICRKQVYKLGSKRPARAVSDVRSIST